MALAVSALFNRGLEVALFRQSPLSGVSQTKARVARHSGWIPGRSESASAKANEPHPVPNSVTYFDTAPYFTTTCSTDSDCRGQKRKGDDPDDCRCIRGYTCGVLATVGPLCCQKLCICKDFLPEQGLSTSDVCLPGDESRASCGNRS